MQTTLQNTHFQKHFGRNDFEEITTQNDVMQSVKYLLKYINLAEQLSMKEYIDPFTGEPIKGSK